MRRFLLALLAASVLVFCGALAATTTASAAPAAESNCIAVLTSFYGPQQAVDDAAHLLQQVAAARGMTFGQLAAEFTQVQGTRQECEAFLGLS